MKPATVLKIQGRNDLDRCDRNVNDHLPAKERVMEERMCRLEERLNFISAAIAQAKDAAARAEESAARVEDSAARADDSAARAKDSAARAVEKAARTERRINMLSQELADEQVVPVVSEWLMREKRITMENLTHEAFYRRYGRTQYAKFLDVSLQQERNTLGHSFALRASSRACRPDADAFLAMLAPLIQEQAQQAQQRRPFVPKVQASYDEWKAVVKQRESQNRRQDGPVA